MTAKTFIRPTTTGQRVTFTGYRGERLTGDTTEPTEEFCGPFSFPGWFVKGTDRKGRAFETGVLTTDLELLADDEADDDDSDRFEGHDDADEILDAGLTDLDLRDREHRDEARAAFDAHEAA